LAFDGIFSSPSVALQSPFSWLSVAFQLPFSSKPFLRIIMSKKRGRSAITNRPPSNRPARSTKATARRVRDLYVAYLHRLGEGPHDPIVEASALRAAELATICEGLRARALAGEDVDANDITRLESTANRAERAMMGGKPIEPSMDWADMQEEARRINAAIAAGEVEP
jgi:hypothetical protein